MQSTSSFATPLILSALVNMYLYGVLNVQVYIYYLSFPLDALSLKLFVYGIFANDTASVIMNIYDIYHWFAKDFGSVSALDQVMLSPVYVPMMGSIVAGSVQLFYSYRIFLLERKAWPISLFIVLVVLTQVMGAFWGGYVGLRAKQFSIAAKVTPLAPALITFIAPAVIDTLIVITMAYLLRRESSSSGRDMRVSVIRIVQLIAETNLLSTCIALISIILFLACKDANYFTFPSLLLGRIYSNSLLLILNNRQFLEINLQNSPPSMNVDIFPMTTRRGRPPTDEIPDQSQRESHEIRIGSNTSVHTEGHGGDDRKRNRSRTSFSESTTWRTNLNPRVETL
ncbi:hypothetical protein CPB83DRAFT_646471 [Crepidotus variabilis]|uniref:DUF6534 domain-containing protein n=1 Tax=Crepidotus variabilis TaxID=179855 RepID=A0A9P6E7L5_9AGAR|nr:hypothetical protein CPB83DRAFT_646471 [Crepidotus variabilis]